MTSSIREKTILVFFGRLAEISFGKSVVMCMHAFLTEALMAARDNERNELNRLFQLTGKQCHKKQCKKEESKCEVAIQN